MFSSITRKLAVALLAALAFALPVAAQEEGEAKVIDEVIAQVNADIITLGQLRREMRQATEALARTGNLTEEQARAEVQKRSGEMVANLITEQLVVQQGKELNFEPRVEEELNRRLVALAKDQNIQFSQLDDAMRQSGVDPQGFRADARRGIMTGLVFNEEVDRRVYESLTPAEVRKYFDQNQAKFRTPETMTLSEIFLSKTGKSETEVRALADRLVREARAGKDFGELAANSDRESTRTAKGKIGTLAMSQIEQGRPEVVSALKNLKVGGVTDPIASDEGYLILRQDERAASGAPVFNEQQVRVVMTEERSTKERVTYLAKLRSDAYLKIADGYRAAVEEALDKQSRPATAAAEPATQPTTTQPVQPATTQPAAQPVRRATPANVAPAGRKP